MAEKKRDRRIKDVSVTKLLDDFIEPESSLDVLSQKQMTDEEYVEMMVKKEIERKLLRRTPSSPVISPDSEEGNVEHQPPPEIPEGSCPSCHFCTTIRKLGNAVYCVCTNPKRELKGMYHKHRMWVRSEPDLGCHKEPPAQKFKKEVRQHFEEQMLQKATNERRVIIVEKKEVTTVTESEITNLFDEQMELVEDIPEVEDLEESDITSVSIKPPDPRRRIVESVLVEDFLNKDTDALHKHRALETLKKYRKEHPITIKKTVEGPITSDKLPPLRRCDTCYFCVDTKRLGGTVWCHCTHVGRTKDTATAASWVRSKINAACWKREELL